MASPSVETKRDELWMFVRCQGPDPSRDCDPQEYLRKKKDVNDIRETLLSNAGTPFESDIISMLYEKKKEDIKKNKEVYEKVQKEKKWRNHVQDVARPYGSSLGFPELFDEKFKFKGRDGSERLNGRSDFEVTKLFEMLKHTSDFPRLIRKGNELVGGRQYRALSDEIVINPALVPILCQAMSDYYEKITKNVDVSLPSIPDETEIKKMASEYHGMKSKSSEPDPETLCTSEEDFSEDEEDIYELIVVDGVDYQVNKEDNIVLRLDDFTPVGTWDKVNERIVWDPACDD